MHRDASFWDRGVRNVPDMTGSKWLLDCSDMKVILPGLGIALPMPSVLDYGCGTGRLHQLSKTYVGVDIAQSAVDYCVAAGIDARHISSVNDIPYGTYGIALCLSVCTHISSAERLELLFALGRYSQELVVDIIPGDGSGSVRMWTADPAEFTGQLQEAGWEVISAFEKPWQAPFETTQHKYYRCVR